MQDIDRIAAYAVEDAEWIAHNCGNPNLRALRNARRGFRRKTDAVDDGEESSTDRAMAGLALTE